MNLKTSFFNKSIFRSDLKRMWWVSALESICIFLSAVFPIMDRLAYAIGVTYSNSNGFNGSIFMLMGISAIFFAIIISAALAIFLFSYVNSPKSVAAMHGLPVKRETMFVTHTLSGIVLFTLPIVVNALILTLFKCVTTIDSFRWMHLIMWAVMILVYSFIAFSGTAAVTMLTGNNVAALVFTGVIAVAPYVTEAFVNYFLSNQLYGYGGTDGMKISGFLYVLPDEFWAQPQNYVKYIVFSVLLLATALIFYCVRNLENNNEVFAFPKIRPVFVYCAALYIGGFGYIYLGEFWEMTNILLFIPLGVIGIIAAEMLTKKSLRVKSAVKPTLIFCAAVCVVWLGFELDITGYERRVPDTEKIVSAEISSSVTGINGNRVYFAGKSGKEVKFEDGSAVFTDKNDIQNIVELHKDLIKNRNYTADDYFVIKYNMDSGKTAAREYHINLTKQKDYLKPVIESTLMREAYLPILKDLPREITLVEIEDVRADESVNYYADDTEAINKIVAALKADAKSTSYEYYASRNDELTSITIEFKRSDSVYFTTGEPVSKEDLPIIRETYQIHADYENTLRVLKELGFYDRMKKAQDVSKIVLDFWGEGAEFIEDRKITDPDEIALIYNGLEDMHVAISNYTSDHNSQMTIYFKSGDGDTERNSTVVYDRNQEGLPDILKGKK